MIRLKRRWLAKGSAATAALLLLSLALPVLALAQAYIFHASYNASTGTVTASVYTDETVTGNVYLDIRDDRDNVIDSVYLAAPTGKVTVGSAVYDRYDFTYTVTKDVYDRLRLTSSYADPDGSGTIVNEPFEVKATPPGNNGGGGGYIPPMPPTNPPADGIVANADGTVDANRLKEALKNNRIVTVKLNGTFVLLPAEALIDAASGTMVRIEKEGISLTLPLSALDFESLGDRTNTEPEDLTIRVDVLPYEGDKLRDATEAVERAGATLRSGVVSFDVRAIGGGGRTAAIDDYDGTYVERAIPVVSPVGSPTRLTGVMLDGAALRFVPTELVYDDNGYVTAAVLKRPGNSEYAVVERSKTFADIGEHWGRADIEAMAGKFIIEGVTAQRFEPDRSITRAEFATLLVRALGLTPDRTANDGFSDVQAADWYAEAVSTAAKAGLVNGYPDGTFRPNATIERAEMATMLVRAIGYVQGTPPQSTIAPSQVEAALAPFDDGDQPTWARTALAIAVREGILQGMTESTLAPSGNATRAQSAVMLKRWLTKIDLIP